MASKLMGSYSFVHLSVLSKDNEVVHMHSHMPPNFLPNQSSAVGIEIDREQDKYREQDKEKYNTMTSEIKRYGRTSGEKRIEKIMQCREIVSEILTNCIKLKLSSILK